MDLLDRPRRITIMRRVAIVLLTAAAWLAIAAPPSGGGATVPRVSAGRGLGVRLPHGWHLVRSVGNWPIIDTCSARIDSAGRAGVLFCGVFPPSVPLGDAELPHMRSVVP